MRLKNKNEAIMPSKKRKMIFGVWENLRAGSILDIVYVIQLGYGALI